MTDKEKAIVMAYTGVYMLSGDKLQIFHKYIEEIMGGPVYTHEMGIKAIDDEIKSRSKTDFIALCAEQDPKTGHWIGIDEEPHEVWECDHCGFVIDGSGCIDPDDYRDTYKFCPNCGAKMESEEQA